MQLVEDQRIEIAEEMARVLAAEHLRQLLLHDVADVLQGGMLSRHLVRLQRHSALDERVDVLLRQWSGGPYIFNLGHGVFPSVDPDTLTRLAALVHDLTAALTTGIDELTRTIDTIKHQAKTVTVGISRADEELLQVPLVVRAARALVDNALAHSGTDRVEVSATGASEGITLVVRDHGVGCTWPQDGVRPAGRGGLAQVSRLADALGGEDGGQRLGAVARLAGQAEILEPDRSHRQWRRLDQPMALVADKDRRIAWRANHEHSFFEPRVEPGEVGDVRAVLPIGPHHQVVVVAVAAKRQVQSQSADGPSVHGDGHADETDFALVEFAARQAADGYTFVIGNLGPAAVNPLISKVPYSNPVNGPIVVEGAEPGDGVADAAEDLLHWYLTGGHLGGAGLLVPIASAYSALKFAGIAFFGLAVLHARFVARR